VHVKTLVSLAAHLCTKEIMRYRVDVLWADQAPAFLLCMRNVILVINKENCFRSQKKEVGEQVYIETVLARIMCSPFLCPV
jgi:hypothetical protein